MPDRNAPPAPGQINRRTFVQGAAAGAATLAFGAQAGFAFQEPDKAAVLGQIPRQHDATLQMLREWIALPSIAAEGLNYPQGADYMAKLARDAGFQHVEVVPTAGKPGVFATLDVGAKNWLGIYFMYDVKQYDPAEWSSPPLEGRRGPRLWQPGRFRTPGHGQGRRPRPGRNSMTPRSRC